MTEASARPSHASRYLLVTGILIMATVVAAVIVMLLQLRNDALAEARQNLSKLGLAIAEQTTRSIQAGDLVLEDLSRQVGGMGLQTIDEFKARLATPDFFRFLKDRADFLPQVDAFTVIAADGKLVNFSRTWPVPPTDLSDRDYVAYFRTHDVQAPFVSAPVQNRGNGVWTAYLVRRVNSPSGEFLGLMLAAIDLGYFQDFFKALTAGADTTVTLLHSDGTAMTSFPATARIGEKLPATSPWYGIIKSGPDVFLTSGVLAPGMRIVSVHPLADYPMVINVSVAEWDALAGWVRTSLVAALSTLVAVLCVAVLLRALVLQFQRLEVSERLLASRNVMLEGTQMRLQAQAVELSTGRSQLAAKSDTLQAALANMNQGIIMVAADGTVAVCNERAAGMLDLPPALVASRPAFDAVVAHQRAAGEFANDPGTPCAFGFERAMAGPQAHERERPGGHILHVETVPVAGGGLVRTYTDITSRRQSERRVNFLAHHDGLTGLANRTMFQARLAELIEAADGSGARLAVFYMDLDGFKLVNDTYGHGVGDGLLLAVARRLQASVRASDLVARMGGDEFAVIQPLTHPGTDPVELATRMLAAVGEEFQFGLVRCSVGLSVGIAVFPDHAASAVELLRNADTALYRAKTSGKRTFRMFDAVLDGGQESRVLMEQDLGRALAEGQLFLEYQPIVDAQTLAVVRFEALLRWRHPVRGEIGSAEFIDIARASGLIVPIGLWALRVACEAAVAWPADVALSVNLSPMQFARGGIADQVEQILSQTGLAPARLNLEITEGVVIGNTSAVVQAMAQLRQRGIRFSLDDFGTAHAGLTYLRSFSFDVLKIDQSYVQDAAKNAQGRAVLAGIQAIGAACGLEVVAEGVETKMELELVQALGCTHVQGYLTGRASAVASITRTRRMRPAPGASHLALVQSS